MPSRRLLLVCGSLGLAVYLCGDVFAAAPYTLAALGTLGGADVNSQAIAVNDTGTAVGSSSTASDLFSPTATEFSGGKVQSLGTPGGMTSTASAINNLGQIVGQSETAGGGSEAFYDDPLSGCPMVSLDLGSSSEAGAINDLGEIVGSSSDSFDVSRMLFASTQMDPARPI